MEDKKEGLFPLDALKTSKKEEKEIEKRINPKVYMEDGKTIISIAFPYYHEDVNEMRQIEL